MKAWIAHAEGVPTMGDIPANVTLEVYSGDDNYPSDPTGVEFWVPPFLAGGNSTKPLQDMTQLKVVQLLSAGVDIWTPLVPEGVTLCNARGAHTSSTSEWAVGAILASMRGFDLFARAQQRSEWSTQQMRTLHGKNVLIIGAGDIGEAIAKRVTAFHARTTMVATTARTGVHGVDELPDLLPMADVVVLIVPLTEKTTGMVDEEFLSFMKDGALLVNAARGPVVKTDALLREVSQQRLWAALDVTDPEPLPAEHPLWQAPNVLITPHVGGAVDGLLENVYELVGEQLRRFAAGETLKNVITGRY